jgi:uncharacterized damage-inducible protein DinB
MTISMDQILKHMAWANQRVYAQIATLPDEALTAYAINPEWHVGEILRHIASSSDWYGYRLTGRQYEDFDAPTTMAGLKEIAAMLVRFDADLLEYSKDPDADVEFVHRSGEKVTRRRSTIVSQAVHHATEHRAQAVSALEAKGFMLVNLDDYDVWGYEISLKTDLPV